MCKAMTVNLDRTTPSIHVESPRDDKAVNETDVAIDSDMRKRCKD